MSGQARAPTNGAPNICSIFVHQYGVTSGSVSTDGAPERGCLS